MLVKTHRSDWSTLTQNRREVVAGSEVAKAEGLSVVVNKFTPKRTNWWSISLCFFFPFSKREAGVSTTTPFRPRWRRSALWTVSFFSFSYPYERTEWTSALNFNAVYWPFDLSRANAFVSSARLCVRFCMLHIVDELQMRASRATYRYQGTLCYQGSTALKWYIT